MLMMLKYRQCFKGQLSVFNDISDETVLGRADLLLLLMFLMNLIKQPLIQGPLIYRRKSINKHLTPRNTIPSSKGRIQDIHAACMGIGARVHSINPCFCHDNAFACVTLWRAINLKFLNYVHCVFSVRRRDPPYNKGK